MTDTVVLWKTEDLGYLTIEAAVAVAKGTLKPGAKSFPSRQLGAIEIQGDQREKIAKILADAGFRPVFAGG